MMRAYRFFRLDDALRIVERLDIEIEDDDAAIRYARDKLFQSSIEIWECARKVARVAPDGAVQMFDAAER